MVILYRVPSGSTPGLGHETRAVDGVCSQAVTTSLGATRCKNNRQSSSIDQRVLFQCLCLAPGELLLQNELPLKEKPEKQNGARRFSEQDHWQTGLILVTSHGQHVVPAVGSDVCTALQKAPV